MKISRNSFVYKVAYGLTDNESETSNLCNFFWRFVIYLLIVWPMTLIGALFIAMSSVVSVLFAYLPDFKGGSHDLYVSVERWPKINGHKVWPATLLFIIFCLYGFYLWGLLITGNMTIPINSRIVVLALVASFFALVWLVGNCFIELFFDIKRKHEDNSSVLSLALNYLKAKKQKVCPIITFED